MVDFDVVMDKLHSFESADDLADYFKSCGIKATPQEATSCAISQFVASETNLWIRTTTYAVEVEGRSDNVKRSHNTEAMKNFIKKFDQGDYLDLVIDGFEFDSPSDDYFCDCEGCG